MKTEEMNKMKPIIILPPDTMHSDAIKALRDNGICVVVAKNPEAVKFIDPIPAISSRTEMENAAIKLSRRLMAGELVGQDYRKNINSLFVDLLVKGTSLDVNGSKQEQQERIYEQEKIDEIRRLARQDAKAERESKKKA